MAPKQWTHDEEIALERCYMDESENKTKGNSQKRENFWKKSNGQTFNHYHVWVAIKDSPKFGVFCQEDNEVQGSSKRTKNSESNEYSPGGSTAHTNYAVNLEDDEEEAEFDTPPEPVRPTGRDTTKQASFSSRQTVSSDPTTTDLADQLQAFTTFQKQKNEDRKKMHEDKTLRADLRAMESLPPEMLDDDDCEIMKKLKKKLFDKYR
ncbi:hypothetical protein R6Q57_024292 [Mikania cordata]